MFSWKLESERSAWPAGAGGLGQGCDQGTESVCGLPMEL